MTNTTPAEAADQLNQIDHPAALALLLDAAHATSWQLAQYVKQARGTDVETCASAAHDQLCRAIRAAERDGTVITERDLTTRRVLSVRPAEPRT